MKTKKTSIKEQVSNFILGKYDATDVQTQIAAGWHDWFCKDESLHKKTKKLYKALLQIVKSNKINPEKQYVFFKNNYPANGILYDDFRICDRESGDVIYTITPKCGLASSNGRAELWGKENNFKEALLIGSWADIKKYFH